MKLTLDTNFLISATLWDTSVAYKLFVKLTNQNAEFFTTKEILEEYSQVLARDFGYSKNEIDLRIQKLLENLKIVEPTTKITAIKDDPDGNKVLECAIASDSEYIITYDKHLLTVQEYEGIKVRAPEEIMHQLHLQ